MGVSIDRLPPRYRAQAAAQLMGLRRPPSLVQAPRPAARKEGEGGLQGVEGGGVRKAHAAQNGARKMLGQYAFAHRVLQNRFVFP